MKRWSWLLTLSLTASVAALFLAPQLSFFGLWTGSRFVGSVFYELGLWAPGVVVWRLGDRLGWVSGTTAMATLLLVSPVAEAAIAWALGIMPAAYEGVVALIIRILAGIGAAFVASRRNAR